MYSSKIINTQFLSLSVGVVKSALANQVLFVHFGNDWYFSVCCFLLLLPRLEIQPLDRCVCVCVHVVHVISVGSKFCGFS